MAWQHPNCWQSQRQISHQVHQIRTTIIMAAAAAVTTATMRTVCRLHQCSVWMVVGCDKRHCRNREYRCKVYNCFLISLVSNWILSGNFYGIPNYTTYIISIKSYHNQPINQTAKEISDALAKQTCFLCNIHLENVGQLCFSLRIASKTLKQLYY